jgi:glycosyltransferase involved in cell wall biosynthesis
MPSPRAVAVVLKGYPRLSETFIAQELLALERRGLDLQIWSLRHPTDRQRHPVHDEVAAPVAYLPEYLHDDPTRVLAAWRRARRLPGYRAARRAWLADLRRDPTRNRVRRFGQACVLAAELPAAVRRIYAHFLHTPASVARYAALMRGLPWCASAHAKDIWTTPDWEAREKLAELDWLATCTAVGRDRLATLSPDPDKVRLVYHGLDFARFPATPRPDDPRDGRGAPVRLLSIGRAVEKKGTDLLLQALARLPDGLAWQFTHIGGGEQLDRLQRLAAELGIADRVAWLGPQAQGRVLAAYREADLFVLASRIAGDGDRDGLPNVLMEAQSQGLCCLATRVSAIPELIRDGATGRLVPPDDVDALAEALTDLIRDPAHRQALGQAGADRVRRNFAMDAGIDRLAGLFGLPPRETPAVRPAEAACASPSTAR